MKLSQKDITPTIKNGRSHVIIPDASTPTGYKSFQWDPTVFFINRGALEENNALNAEPFHVYPTGPATINLPSAANKTGTLKAYGGTDKELIYTTFTSNLLEIWGIKRVSGTWGSWSKVTGSSGFQIASCDGVSVLDIEVPGLYANGPTTTDLPPGTNILGIVQVLIETSSNSKWLRYQVVRNNVTEIWYNARIDNTWRGWTKIPTEDYPDLVQNETINTGNYFFRIIADDGIADNSTFRIDPDVVIFGHNENQMSISDAGIIASVIDGDFDFSTDNEEGLTAQFQLQPGYFYLQMTDMGASGAEIGADGYSLWLGKNGNSLTFLDNKILINTEGSNKMVEYEQDLSAVVPGANSIVPYSIIQSKIQNAYPSLTNFPRPGAESKALLAINIKTWFYWNQTISDYLPINASVPEGAITNDVTEGEKWNATTNTPTLYSGTGSAGDYFIVGVAGTTSLDGIAIWAVNDIGWFNATLGTWQKIDNTTQVLPAHNELDNLNWAVSGHKSGINEARVACFDENGDPHLCETQTSALYVGDYTTDFPDLAVASNWTNNIASLPGTLGDRAIGIDELKSVSESFFTQYGWARDFINSFIEDATIIAALETPGNWTKVSDIFSYYNAAKGDRNQTYYNNGVFYFCFGTSSHTWLRYGNLDVEVISDTAYIPKPQIELGKADNDTLTILATFDIVHITVEAETTTAGNISIGSADGLSDIVASTALPTTIGQKLRLTYIIDVNYPTDADRTMHINIDSAATVTLHIITQKMFE